MIQGFSASRSDPCPVAFADRRAAIWNAQAGWDAEKYAYNRRFSKFKLLDSKGPVAQSVEQRIENPCVGGSIPSQATRLKALDQQ